MDKKKIVKGIIDELEREFETLAAAANEAKEAATSEESKAENKYDTRGLEASYLAGAQAKRAQEIQDVLDVFRRMDIRDYDSKTPIEATALVEVCVDGEENKWFFMVPQEGGMKIDIGKESILTISPESPLGKLLFRKVVGDSFDFTVKDETKDYEIVSVS